MYAHKTRQLEKRSGRVEGQGGRAGGNGGGGGGLLVFILVGLHSKLQCQVDKQDQSSEFKISMFAENL